MLQRPRRLLLAAVTLIVLAVLTVPVLIERSPPLPSVQPVVSQSPALSALGTLAVGDQAPPTPYARDEFGSGWATVNGCETRAVILNRDLQNTVIGDECRIIGGSLDDPYTGTIITYDPAQPSAIQIDHVVALSDAWRSGAWLLSDERRRQFANDPLELLAVSGAQNQEKGDGAAHEWLPPQRAFHCQYAARQVAIKLKYGLWVAQPEKAALEKVLSGCADQPLPSK